ncbi:conserved exported hypothetical protein [Tenacibaculum sp. 190524A02b]|uniref:DUF676 domain-containing protein n=1 Tax=Tenacibaculum vairaonense TaxID=3137860 RepID=A0ABM9PHQ1_9FLAO
MKRILFWLCLVLGTTITIAQQTTNTNFAQQMNTLFGSLQKNKIPHGILLDMAMEFTDVPAVNGQLTNNNYISPRRLKEIQKTLFMGKITSQSNNLIPPDDLEEQWYKERAENHIALAGLYFKYARFVHNATTAGKLTYSNGKFYDRYIGNRWLNPYETLSTFAMTAPIQVYTGLQIKVKLPQNIFYSNNAQQVQKIEADFADGKGYRRIHYNQLVTVNYAVEGNKIWKYKLTLTNGQVLYSHSKIKIKKGKHFPLINNTLVKHQKQQQACGLYSKDIVASKSYLGKHGKARIFIDDAGNDCKITKPLIVIEGWDVTTLLNPETKYSSEDYDKFIKSIDESNSDLEDIIINKHEYDLIFVNWDHGMDYIQRNALVVEEVIKWVNQQKALSGSTEKNVIIGQSMGGVVSRYALRDMEQRNLTHQVRLFVSHDAPQQGANIPLSIQYMYRNARNQLVKAPLYHVVKLFTSNHTAHKYLTILDQPATSQLLVNRANNNYDLDNAMHINFYNELNAKGYPKQNGIRNIAISNGSECGTTQNFNAGEPLVQFSYHKSLSFLQDIASLFVFPAIGGTLGLLVDPDFFKVGIMGAIPGNSKFDVNLTDRSLYPNGGNNIHSFQVSYTKKILWLFSVKTHIVNKKINQPHAINKHYDNFGGGYIGVGEYVGKANIGGLTMRDKFTIVPTPSALGISAANNTHFNKPYVGAFPPTAPLNTPFDNFTTGFKGTTNTNNNNEKHLEFNARNGNWLAAELNTKNIYKTDCSAFCSNVFITGKSLICNTNTYSLIGGITPQWTITKGNHLVTQSISGNQITLTRKPNVNGPVTLAAKVGSNTRHC